MALNIVFITGFPRSGTTLVERILGNQSNVYIAHQLFPTLFLNIKKFYLKNSGISRSYPFLPKPSEEEQEGFLGFLNNTEFTSDQIKAWMMEGLDYVAMGEKQLLSGLPEIEGKLIDIIGKLLLELASSENVLLGFKDVMMDEFIPYFKSKGVKVISVIRDPRAMIYSLINSEEMGDYRPTLFNLQVWKRGLLMANSSNSYVIKYEKLIQEFEFEIRRLGEFLDKELDLDVFPLKKNDQQVWSNNTSFNQSKGLSKASLSSYETGLSKDAIAYIESVCFNEMIDLGYSLTIKHPFNCTELKEPFEVNHKAFLDWDNSAELQKELKS